MIQNHLILVFKGDTREFLCGVIGEQNGLQMSYASEILVVAIFFRGRQFETGPRPHSGLKGGENGQILLF